MHYAQKRATVLILFFAGIGLLVSTGCGKAAYEDAMRNRVKTLAFASNFIEGLNAGTEVIEDRDGTIAEFRMPTAIKTDSRFTSRSKNRQGFAIDKRRIQPPGIKLPGFRYSYETFVDMGGRNNTHPVYAYFAAVPGSDPVAKVKNAIKKGGWQNVTLDTPDRQQLNFAKLSVTGTQEFELSPNGGEIEKKPGKLEIYVHSTPAHHVIIGFRGTNEADEKVKLFDAVPFSLGTLEVMGGDEEGGSDES